MLFKVRKQTACGSYLSGEKQYAFVVNAFTNSWSLGKPLSLSPVAKRLLGVFFPSAHSQWSPIWNISWLSDVPASSQASPHLQTPHRNLQAQCPRAPWGTMEEPSPAPPLPVGSLLEDDEDAVLPQSFFPYLLCVEPDNTLGLGKLTSLKQWKLKRCFSFLGSSISSGMFLMKR